MTPGPTEPSGSQPQHYMKLIVDDLLNLYENGVVYHTPAFPQGCLVHVALLSIICNHPAMCKASIFSDESLHNEFPPQTSEGHQEKCYEDCHIRTDQDHDACFKKHGVRWTGLARLTYFNLVRCMIIDPMHNLFLSIVKTLWYNKWIQTSALHKSTDKSAQELNIIHKFLATMHICLVLVSSPSLTQNQFEVPLWVGQLPSHVGEPAGGSLTVDEYKLAVTYTWPIVITIVWDMYLEASTKKLDEWRTQSRPAHVHAQTFKKRKVDTELKPPKEPRPRLHADEPVNLLHLSTALEIFCESSISKDLLPRASTLFQDFLFEYRRLDGAKAMKPNFHWAVHLEEQI
ncbi:hypothetical protein BD769DRAFT_1678950 [Suillus cothurnatus]|nr:hypothetical protein BD769DRAFT_1678950 [Suillus cothurnatus]